MHTRRHFLEITGLSAAALATASCDRVCAPAVPRAPEPVARTREEREARRFLQRFSYGPRPGDTARVARDGARAWLDGQLESASIDDRRAERLVRRIEAVNLAPA